MCVSPKQSETFRSISGDGKKKAPSSYNSNGELKKKKRLDAFNLYF